LPSLRLRFLTGPRRGQAARFGGPLVRIGRSRDNDVVLADSDAPESSGHHAEIVREHGRWWIRDLESTNGTFLNGTRVSRAQLRSGDAIAVGADHLAVETGRSFLLAASLAVLAVVALVASYILVIRPAPDLQRSAALVARSVYLIAIDGPSGRRPLGTGFAVRADRLLATNAHVAEALRPALSSDGHRPIAILSDSTEVHTILEVHVHPRWRAGSIADDVALLRIDGTDAIAALQVADAATVAGLPRGLALASFGFPAAGLDAMHPRGRLATDILGDVRDQRYLAIGLDVAPGTSGSPIFRGDGVVVGLVAGGDFVSGTSRDPRSAGNGVNWGISVAAVHDLLAQR
jgi:hypothetical protein